MPVRISAVSYLNTYPFVYGLQASGLLTGFGLDLAVPSECARKLSAGEADLALVPAGALPGIGKYHYTSDFCIGAVGPVLTVVLFSKVPLNQITEISLDPDSRTSVELVKILAKHHWNIRPAWNGLAPGELAAGRMPESVVAIGDKTFALGEHYPYRYDMAEAWMEMTGLPFVFAVWISKKELPATFLAGFNAALGYGVSRIDECIRYFSDSLPPCGDCLRYLRDNISYPFDDAKKQGLKKFLEYLG